VKLPLALATLVGAAAISSSAAADGGYYSGALGARAAGRSGAFAARADDPTAVQYNPAGLANIGGTVIMVGDRVSYNGYTYTRAPTQDWGHPNPDGSAPTVTFAQVHNETPWQGLEPLIIAASDLGMRDWGFALGAFAAPGASKFNFPEGGGSRYMMLSREAIILDYTASAAWKYHDLFGIGATAEWIYVPRLNYSLMVDGSPLNMADNPVSSDLDMVATTKGSDPFTFNAILGAWLRPRPWLQFGLAGQVVPASIETKSTLSITPVNLTMADPPVLTRDGSSARAIGAWPARARYSTSSSTSNTRPGRGSTSSRSTRTIWMRSFRARRFRSARSPSPSTGATPWRSSWAATGR
jgi:hypothetical protein